MPEFRILHIIGARPHFMKLAPISNAIKKSSSLREIIVHTGQHYSDALSGAFIREFDLPEPHYHLGVGSGSHVTQVGRIITALDDVFAEARPDIVFVYGDTNSTAAGAIAAAKSHIPVAHVEAGLREWNKSIPEEVNKMLTDAVADICFCPTQTAVENLARIGITKNVFLTGDTVIDLLVHFSGHADVASGRILDDLGLRQNEYYFMTCHRAANTDSAESLKEILTAAGQLDRRVVFPVHPRTTAAISGHGFGDLLAHPNIIAVSPQGFWVTQGLIRNARAAITDSGGVIKEAYFHKTPCVIIDRQTEWIESVDEGWAVVTGPHADAIVDAAQKDALPVTHDNTFGNGRAAEAILQHTIDFLTRRQ